MNQYLVSFLNYQLDNFTECPILSKGSLKALYLEGNSNITDWSYVSKCTWPNGKSGF